MKEPLELTPAALYARVSSDRQDVDLSVAAQMRALRDYAKSNGYTVAREYVDEAESGRIADRPQFRKMIERAAGPRAPFEVILGLEVLQVHPQAGARRGLQVHAAPQGHPRRLYHRARRRLPHRQADGGHHRERGRILLARILHKRSCVGCGRPRPGATSSAPGRPFGYKRVKVHDGMKERPTLEVDPEAAPIVQEIFESSMRGNGLKEICKDLNNRGITNKGKRWQKNVLRYLLTNESYTGTAVWGLKTKDEKGVEPVRVENAWPAWCRGRPSTWCSRGCGSGRPRWCGPETWAASTCSAGCSAAACAASPTPAREPRAASSPTTSAPACSAREPGPAPPAT